ncbi:hypothetical protein I8H57_004205 [Enterobacter cloacae]|nr:hypothetical protein [Enterobacter cloacae]
MKMQFRLSEYSSHHTVRRLTSVLVLVGAKIVPASVVNECAGGRADLPSA